MEATATGKEIAVPKTKHAGEKLTGGVISRLEPQTFGELEHLANVLAKSDIVTKELIGKPANVLLVLMAGNEIGLTAGQSLQSIMVVNGRTSLWGDALMGKVLASPVYESSRDEFDFKTMTATFTVKRKGQEPLTRTFSQADAVKAGLWTKAGPWTNYPRRMLFHRARSWALRDAFADVLKGLRYYEEERDIINLEKTTGMTYEMPRTIGEEMPAAEHMPAIEPEPTATAPAQTDGDSLGEPAPTEVTFIPQDFKAIVVKGKGLTFWTKDREGATYFSNDPEVGAAMKAAHLDKAALILKCRPSQTTEGPAQYPVLGAKLA